jgi:hypothetical protein
MSEQETLLYPDVMIMMMMGNMTYIHPKLKHIFLFVLISNCNSVFAV